MSLDNVGRAAGGLLGGYLIAKLALPAGALFLGLLLVVGTLANPGEAFVGDSCGDVGMPDVEVGNPEGTHYEQQIANARTIDQVAANHDLPGRATLIALMTALQESTLINVDYGDRDSLGLFQQRPSQGWGTPEQIQDPVYAATMFFTGGDDGDPPGLTDIDGWETMPLGDAAQAVQRSAYPDLYAGQESHARQIADAAGIDLERVGRGPGPADPTQPEEPSDTEGDEGGDCYPDEDTSGAPGNPFIDSPYTAWPSVVDNPRDAQAAIEWARDQAADGSDDWYRACLSFVAQAYGWGGSGVTYAVDHYHEMPSNMRNNLSRTVPPGALMYWDTGGRAGHVAIYLGDGQVASNDILRPGYIDIVDATEIESRWGATYLGWAPPYFPRGW